MTYIQTPHELKDTETQTLEAFSILKSLQPSEIYDFLGLYTDKAELLQMLRDKPSFCITLPYPPSVNSLYLNGKGKARIKTEKYKKWITESDAKALTLRHKFKQFTSPIIIRLQFKRPDQRTRDIDNLSKPILDFLTRYNIIIDDSFKYIQGLSSSWINTGGGPRVVVEIYEI
jgi:Holliday junction resolvase RusA-like endonuclease